MNALLSLIEKLLIGMLALGLGALIIVSVIRYGGEESGEGGSWHHAKKKNTIEAYLEFLRDCQSCAHESDAEAALDKLQEPLGLVARLAQAHLSERASIASPMFSPDGQTVLALGGAGPDFWDINTGARLPHQKSGFQTGGSEPILALAYSHDGRQIAAGMPGTEHGGLVLWDRQTGKRVAEQIIHGYDAQALAFAPQDQMLAWLAHGPVGIWEPETGKFLRATHEDASALAFSKGEQGHLVLLTVSGRELWTWEPGTMERIKQESIDSDRPFLGLSQDGRVAAYAAGPILELWDTRTASLINTLTEHEDDVISFCRDPKKGWVLVGTRSGNLYLWAPKAGELLAMIPAHEGPIVQLACSGRGRGVTVSWNSAKVWNLERLRSSNVGSKPKPEE